jgi:hypothetical protein
VSAALSVILVTDSFDAVATALGRYRDATDPARVELVIAAVGPDPRLTAALLADAGFPNARVVDGGDGTLQQAEWRAFQATTAPLVVFGQAHAFPRPGFGAALLAAWSEGRAPARGRARWAVVGPTVANANPETLVSRAAMWLSFGRWVDDPPRGEWSDVPGHNSGYDRAALAELGNDLVGYLEAGWQLQEALKARGHRCFLEPAARMDIVNPSRLGPFVAHFFHLGRLVAAQRCQRWSAWRRVAWALGSPLIPLVRLQRIVRDSIRRRTQAPWIALPVLFLGLVASAAGEATAFLCGPAARARFVRKA